MTLAALGLPGKSSLGSPEIQVKLSTACGTSNQVGRATQE